MLTSLVSTSPMAARAGSVDVSVAALGAATRLFAKRGFEATSLQDIANEVGVTKPAILHHFPSKEELRRAVLAAILDHWRERLPAILLAATAADDRFDGVLGGFPRVLRRRPGSRAARRPRDARPARRDPRAHARARPPVDQRGRALHRARQGEGRAPHPDVDAEAYTVHVLSLVISALASERRRRRAREARHDDRRRARAVLAAELGRIARASLFVHPAPTASRPATPARKPPSAPSARSPKRKP